MAQFRVDGFTFSKMVPYTSWEEVFAEALRLWRVYVQVASPRQVARIAVRYINRMRVPGGTDPARVLEAPPSVPVPIPQVIRDFLTRVYIEDALRSLSAVIIQALEQRVDSQGALSFLFGH